MSFHQCNPDCREYTITEKGRRILQWANACEHTYVVEGNKLVCRWCSAEYVLARRSFGGADRDRKGD